MSEVYRQFPGTSSSSRSRPVVRVSATVELEAVAGKIDPENRTCSLISGTKVACLSLQGCLLYEGEAVTEELGKFYDFLLAVFEAKLSSISL